MNSDNPSHGIYQLPPGLSDDIATMRQKVAQLQAGEITPEQFHAFRVPQGVYEQREAGRHMMRVRLPAGGIFPAQMRAIAVVSTQFGNGVLHVTTRQDIQIHRVPLDGSHPALVALQAADLSTKGGCGDAVRNITACPHSGICPHQMSDVTPHVVAVTEFMLNDPGSFKLPRKYKICFSGCGSDCAGAGVNDLGFIARRRDGVDGFAVYAGGGMGAHCRVADKLEEFVPASDAHLIAEAVKRVFSRHGDRENRRKARLRFLIERIGFDAFRKLYEKELAALRADRPAAPQVREIAVPTREPAEPVEPVDGFDAWRKRNVIPQKQDGYFTVEIPLFLGDIAADDMIALAGVVEEYGGGMLRTTPSQNAVIRWVHERELPAVHARLVEIGLGAGPPSVVREMVSCTGAATCRLGICLSRGLATAMKDALESSGIDLAALGDLRIHVSGCPNSCGRHPLAQIGFRGCTRRVDGESVPHYLIQLGGRIQEGAVELASGTATLPARNVPDFLVALLKAFKESNEFPDFHAFLKAGGRQIAAEVAQCHTRLPDRDKDPDAWLDWGAETPS